MDMDNGDFNDMNNDMNNDFMNDMNNNGIPDEVEFDDMQPAPTSVPFPRNDEGILGPNEVGSPGRGNGRGGGGGAGKAGGAGNADGSGKKRPPEWVKVLIFVIVVVLMFGSIAGTFFYLSRRIDNFSLGDSFHDLSDTLSGKNAPQDPANLEQNKKDIEKLQEYYDQENDNDKNSDNSSEAGVDQQGLVGASPQERAVARKLMRIYSTCSLLKKIAADNSGDEQVTLNQTGTALTLVSGPDSSMKVFECVVGRLNVPDASVNQMRARKETSETQKLEWDKYAAEWSYQKDVGLTLFVYPGSSASSSSSDPVLK
ncbi:hypothetical protein [Aeriscardovia aeriphila]|uniref:Uncharacterized protein n=1 Tax=Aeriscardovia aeriphila TaxID=218139 RepID=A0A261F8G2_9BIFI|nr:hypothetical protein [Aeriscardovia aeriphila]NYI25276.1 hypothetical protein [Aeriscardovia aeriphila]OZG55176.1 hypothetical protein AEAE_1154 [Aeriscardovia aeriphila]